MANLRRASVKQLANKIKGFTKYPRFAFLLGAGASRQSGIITAGEMIRFFKERIISETCQSQLQTDDDREQWLQSQDWYNKEVSDYCQLFEQFEPKEIGRQRYIESIIEGQEPSFGYVVLANLMASNYVNTIITTNFDDLVYSACTSYTAIRPIVYAYGVLASEMRITAERPKILKLHGDYLYSPLKNTDSETAVQDPNMARQLTQVLSEYGLVVIGYSGGDDSVLEVLSKISNKNDLYWCVRRGEVVNKNVEKLLIEKGGFVVEIEGFDELLNEIRHIVGFDVGKMLGSIQDRQDRMIDKLKNFPLEYSADILAETVEALKAQAKQEAEQLTKTEALSYFIQAWQAEQKKDLQRAEDLLRKSIALAPDAASHNNLGRLLQMKDPPNTADAEQEYRKAIELGPHVAILHNNLGSLIMISRPQEAEQALRKAIELDPNMSMSYSNLGHLLIHKGQDSYVEAETLLTTGIAVDVTFIWNYWNLMYLYRVTDRIVDMMQLAEKTLQLNKDDIAAILALCCGHKKLNNQADSAKYGGIARELIKPDDWHNLAMLETIVGNGDAAIENLKKATFDWRGREWLEQDREFDWLRDNPEFNAVIDRIPLKPIETPAKKSASS